MKRTAAAVLLALTIAANAFGAERAVNISFELTIPPAAAVPARLWVPLPLSDEYQQIDRPVVDGTADDNGVRREHRFGSALVHAAWNGAITERRLRFSFTARRKAVTGVRPAALTADELARNLDLSHLGAAEQKVRAIAGRITAGRTTPTDKARAVYDWVVENMHRDPAVKGCGMGDVERLLTQKGGKCVDIHTVYVALARAAGVAAREIYGIRLPKGAAGDMTKAQHCWVEVYLPDSGWLSVDPADVRKIMLEQKLTLEQAKPWREYFFGKIDENRIAFGTGKNIMLDPPQAAGPLLYFGYPYVEAGGTPLNEDLFGFNLGYKISFVEI